MIICLHCQVCHTLGYFLFRLFSTSHLACRFELGNSAPPTSVLWVCKQFVFMFFVLSDVLQWCLLSGSLLLTIIDPLLHLFKKHFDDSALASFRACADDIGMALKRMATILVLCQWGEDFFISGRTFSPSKCIIALISFLCQFC